MAKPLKSTATGGLPLRFTRAEWAGAFGDVGILLPLAIALIAQNGMNGTAVFLCTGLMYIGCGLYYRIPMPVQPLKAAAAIAIATGMAPGMLSAAGVMMGALLLLMAVTRLSELLGRIFTLPVIRGIQLGVGLLMIKGGIALFAKPALGVAQGAPPRLSLPVLGTVPLGVVVGVGAAILLLVLLGNRRIPAALAVLGVGTVAGIAVGYTTLPSGITLGAAPIALSMPPAEMLAAAFVMLVIPQLPLTFGNAIVCASNTARDYYGAQARRATPVALSTSLGVGNVITGLVGGMPMCHGAGGLTAHYKFGARTMAAPLIIGTALVLFALLFGASAATLAAIIPPAVLGVLLIYIGIEHGMLVRHVVADREGFFVALTIGGITIVAGTLTAVTVGIALAFILRRRPLPMPQH
ncbi:MAG: sulfate permease [Nitrospirae bacterium]|nr:sulfate permease [Nitrospirota bacterium]